ncbi:MAG: DNA recombination protein RmuC [Verrucomicrobia bacterium]|nr:DNA recombination protein RmuC [Verrucomicrobiota bacterium]MCF7707348.1 DNA recombination protein RmuC [Verrucomicrobiota bacterium]
MSEFLFICLGLVFGGVLGGAAGWILGSRHARKNRNESLSGLENELRRQNGRLEEEVEVLRGNLSETASARSAAEARLEAMEQYMADQKRLFDRNLAEMKEDRERALSNLKEAFQGLSAETLKQVQPDFLRLANETLSKFHETAKGDLAKRQESILGMLKPLEEQLDAYQKRLSHSESSQAAALGEVRKQFENLAGQSNTLANETLQLRRILSSSQARGRWGEDTLRRVVEAAGMSPHCDFKEQMTSESGESKPDMIVHLPGEREIIIDAKVPDIDCLRDMDASEPAIRDNALKSLAARMRSTIKGLSDRAYPKRFNNALDHVVLFLPAESLFSRALEGDPDLIVWASAKNVLIATPASLIALLRTVSLSWQQHAQTENAKMIAGAAQELYSRICTFAGHFDNIRSGLERANRAYNDAVGSFERSVRPSGERLKKLGIGAVGKDIANITEVEEPLRLLSDS